jgi:hypothetical protein
MARWRVTGADRATGADVTVEVEAASRDAAVVEAGRRLLISEIEAIPEPAPPPRTPPAGEKQPSTRPLGIPPLGFGDDGLSRRERYATRAMRVAAVVMYAIGFLGLFTSGMAAGVSHWDSGSDHFHADNAIGATANAAQDLVRHMERVEGRLESIYHLAASIALLLLGAAWHVIATMVDSRGAARFTYVRRT